MRRRRKFKAKLALGGAVAVLFVVLACHDLIKDITEESTAITEKRSGRYRLTVNCLL